jgi:hypothetical protein
MVKDIKMGRVRPTKSLNFAKIIEPGQNVNQFTAQTANGTAKWGNRAGWNRQWDNMNQQPYPEAEATGAWTQANRTGE